MIRYLLDTNVLSEMRKSRPNPAVHRFVTDAPAFTLHMSILSIGELRKGIALKRKSDAGTADVLQRWADGLEEGFANRTLPVDKEVVKLWGEWSAHRSRTVVDTLIAATAAVHDMVLVTRNVGDVHDLPVRILNPWQG